MIDSTTNAMDAVWLDPVSPLSDTERGQLGQVGIRLHTVSTLDELKVALKKTHLLVIRLGENVELLKEVQTLINLLGRKVPVLCRVERRRIEVAVEAMRLGALHVLSSDELSPAVWSDAVANIRAQAVKADAPASSTQPASYVFVDPASQHLLALAQKVALTDVTVLLVGPTGAGKEVLARVLHESSPRAKGPFVAMNCAALPENLIEDMLFGHEKGAFTGALKDHKGLFEQGYGGTVFLDEIGEMPIHLQAKLLRVLQERKLNRLGGETPINLDVRIVAATNKDLRRAIDEREFREDLYFRISTFRLSIQPLRARVGDIMPLVMQSLARHGNPALKYSVSDQAQQLLNTYQWPGNVRELENVIQRAVVLCADNYITAEHLMFDESAGFEISTPQGGQGGMYKNEGLVEKVQAVGVGATHSFYGPSQGEINDSGVNNARHNLGSDHQGLGYTHSLRKEEALSHPVANMTSALAKHVISDHGANQHPLPLAASAGSSAYLQGPSSLSDEGVPGQSGQNSIDLNTAIKAREHLVIMAAIKTSENRIEAAKKLGISPRTLRYKLAQLRDRGMTMASMD